MNELASPLDRLALLQTFVRIVDAGSISAAAAQLRTTQPTVSRRLQALEQSLGLHLIKRTTHSMKLTEDGERCYERAKELTADWEAFEADLKGAKAEPKGHLRIVAPHAFGQRRLVVPLVEFLEKHPGVTVDWMLRDNVHDFVSAGIDCAIQVGEVTEPGIVAIKLYEVPRIVAISPSLLQNLPTQPTTAKELEELPWLSISTFYRNTVTLKHTETGQSMRLSIQPKMSTDSLYALRSASVLGLGACVGSAWLLEEDIAAGHLVRLVPEWEAEPLPVHLIYPQAPYYPARLRSFIQHMRQSIPESFAIVSSHAKIESGNLRR